MDFQIARFFIRTAGPLNLFGGMLMYVLGVGISRYLGVSINWLVVILGQIWVTTYQVGSRYLAGYFLLKTMDRNENLICVEDKKEEKNHRWIRRDLFLWAGFASFAAMTSITLILMQLKSFTNPFLIVMGLAVVLSTIFAIPPFYLGRSGYGELIQMICMTTLIPALGFMLQEGELHRLVTLSTFSLNMLYLAMLIALELPQYSQNQKLQIKTMLVRLGWERGMFFHNLLILASFLVLGIAMVFGLPPIIAFPAFFVLPLGLFQIWYMTRIAHGVKPNWRILNLTAIMTFGLTAYLITFSFWIR